MIFDRGQVAARQRAAQGRGRVAGFTLIELMIVVAVVAILVGIALPAYQDSVRKARRGQAKADLVELAGRAERYRTVNNKYNGAAGGGFWNTITSDFRRSPRGTGDAFYRIDEVETANTFTLTAVPLNGQTKDTLCMTLSLDNTGKKVASADATNANRCW